MRCQWRPAFSRPISGEMIQFDNLFIFGWRKPPNRSRSKYTYMWYTRISSPYDIDDRRYRSWNRQVVPKTALQRFSLQHCSFTARDTQIARSEKNACHRLLKRRQQAQNPIQDSVSVLRQIFNCRLKPWCRSGVWSCSPAASSGGATQSSGIGANAAARAMQDRLSQKGLKSSQPGGASPPLATVVSGCASNLTLFGFLSKGHEQVRQGDVYTSKKTTWNVNKNHAFLHLQKKGSLEPTNA